MTDDRSIKSEELRSKSKLKFFKLFPKGFRDKNYLSKERDIIWYAHLQWNELLNREKFESIITNENYFKIIETVNSIFLKAKLLVSSEKKGLHYLLKNKNSAKLFSIGLYDNIYGQGTMEMRFENFAKVLLTLSNSKLKLATWHTTSVFAFVANPELNILLKPKIAQAAAKKYNYKEFDFISKPNWATYKSLLNFADRIYIDLKKEQPLDMIDIHSFINVTGSTKY